MLEENQNPVYVIIFMLLSSFSDSMLSDSELCVLKKFKTIFVTKSYTLGFIYNHLLTYPRSLF
jgi:hypothetical protein